MANEEKLNKVKGRGFRYHTTGTFVESIGEITEHREVG